MKINRLMRQTFCLKVAAEVAKKEIDSDKLKIDVVADGKAYSTLVYFTFNLHDCCTFEMKEEFYAGVRENRSTYTVVEQFYAKLNYFIQSINANMIGLKGVLDTMCTVKTLDYNEEEN